MHDYNLTKLDSKIVDDDDDDSRDSDVTTVGNKIYFYSDVGRNNLNLNKSIVELNNKLLQYQTSLGVDNLKIELNINSYGGALFDGLASVDYIRNSRIPITTVINGCAASAATLMSVVGAERKMYKHSYMLIHQLSTGMWGKYSELKDEVESCDSMMKTIKEIYAEYTKIPKRQLNSLLSRDVWWDSDKCLEYGLIDEII